LAPLITSLLFYHYAHISRENKKREPNKSKENENKQTKEMNFPFDERGEGIGTKAI